MDLVTAAEYLTGRIAAFSRAMAVRNLGAARAIVDEIRARLGDDAVALAVSRIGDQALRTYLTTPSAQGGVR